MDQSVTMRLLASLASLMIFVNLGFSQGPPPGSISGSLTDSIEGGVLEYASVVLKFQKTDSLASGTLSDDKGRFELSGLRPGIYKLEVAFMGYEKLERAGLQIKPGQDLDMGKLRLVPSSVQVGEVEITARQDIMVNSIDKKEYNVERNLTATGGSVNDLLNTIPSLEVDIDGNISLRGNANVTVLIDGKPSALTGAGRTAILQQIPASSIKSVEVITNPSARYDPDGMAGIINIVTKKSKTPGVNGTVSLGIGTRNKYNGAASLNLRTKHFNAFTNYSIRDERRFSNGTGYTFTPTDSLSPYLDQESDGIRRESSHSFRAGMDIYVASKTTLGLAGTYNLGSQREDELNSFEESDWANQPYSVYTRPNINNQKSKGYEGELSLQQRFKQLGRSLDARLAYSANNSTEDSYFRTIHSIEGGLPSTLPDDLQNNYQTDETELGTAQIDYVHPINEKSKLEAGAKATSRDILNGFRSESMVANIGEFQPDSLLNNDFQYKERILAAYGIYARNLSTRWAMQLGLRAEQALTTSILVNDNSTYHNDYFNLFPNAYLSFKPAEKQELRLSYSRRINRPSTRQLNPFTDYSNPKRLRRGNPYLLPEYIDAIEMGWNKEFKWGSLNANAYYRYTTNNHMRYITQLGADTLEVTFVNLLNGQNYGLELISQSKPAKWMDLTASANFFQTVINAGNLEPDLQVNNLGMTGQVMSTIYFGKNTSLQFSANYRSPRRSAQGRISAMFFSDIALKQNILKGKGSLNLRFSDIANTQRFKVKAETEGILTDFYRKRESQILYLTFSYRFGKQDISSKRKKREESENRGGGGGDMDF